ncbi:hypothetical protein WKK05_39645 (plasmid) [Nostoc sp. UHCC 0302]
MIKLYGHELSGNSYKAKLMLERVKHLPGFVGMIGIAEPVAV